MNWEYTINVKNLPKPINGNTPEPKILSMWASRTEVHGKPNLSLMGMYGDPYEIIFWQSVRSKGRGIE
ncbi:hypothetical protein CN957_22785 [Bacillus cereus]|nr:hypothetical protein CN467_05770 [Bacillus cereus]PEX96118.1 hypothetical protein CN465_10510 [Bacillus cereus]PGM77289.1 hypothetical protein CN957_22785 [Bacillus cereus]